MGIAKNFLDLCKTFDLEKVKKYYLENKEIIDNIIKKWNNDKKSTYDWINYFFKNKKIDIINFLQEIELFDLYGCLNVVVQNDNFELAKYIVQLPNYYIFDDLHDACCDCDLKYAKYILNLVPNLDICYDNDELMRRLCVYDYENKRFSDEENDKRLEFICWILEEVKPDYDIIAIKTIKDGIKNNRYNYPILKYLNEYIDKREKIILQEMINKCVMDNYIIFATATNK
jgi:hypothetical protein